MNAFDCRKEIDCILAFSSATSAEFSMYSIPSTTDMAAVCGPLATWLCITMFDSHTGANAAARIG